METTLSKSQEIHLLLKYLLRTGASLEKSGNRILNEFELNQQQFIVLNEIKRKKSITANEIVVELGYEKSNISKTVKKLKSLEYIETESNPDDKRIIQVNITKAGTQIWKKCIHKMERENNTLFEDIDLEDITVMKEYVYKISEIILKK